MHRFFIEKIEQLNEKIKISDPKQIHQIKNVLRLKLGEEIAVFDSSGQHFLVILESLNNNLITAKIIKEIRKNVEPKIKITLYQALLKKDNFEWVIKQGTSLGIDTFVPIITERCIVRQISEEKIKRWQKISQEASEQSGRIKIPEIKPVQNYFHILENMKIESLNLIAWEKAKKSLREILPKEKPESINLFIGPEGSFTEKEIKLAEKNNIKSFNFGPRILRAELAGLAIATAIFYHYQEC